MAKRKRLYKKNALTASTFKGGKAVMDEELMESVHVQRGRLHLRISVGVAGSIEIHSTSGRMTLEALDRDRIIIRKARREPAGGI